MAWRITMLRIFLLGFLVVALTDANKECYECTDMPHPGDCTVSTICTDQQKCFIRQFITTGGLILYNSGCESKQRCSLTGKRGLDNNSSSINRRSDIPVCEECCDGDFCNDAGCGTLPIKQPARGPMCFNCDYIDDPKGCRHVAKCEVGAECMLHELVNHEATLNVKQYQTMCVSPLVCAAYSHLPQAAVPAGKRAIPQSFCHVCCKDDYCNNRCPP